VGKRNRRQTGFEGGGKNFERAAFRPEKIKDRLLEFLAVIKRRKQIKGRFLSRWAARCRQNFARQKHGGRAWKKICTHLARGMRDEAEIRGHRRTYVGAMPGRIIQTMRRVESRNPVILLDELDKVGADFRGDPASALLEVLDPAQNHTFTDHYLDLPFDLSRVLFIATANWLEPIHPALRDRLEVIELPSYTESEKLQIAKRYLVPRQIEEHGLTKKDVKFSDAALRGLIRSYTREAGVRQLEREIAALTRKAVRKIISKNGAASAVKLNANELEGYLGHAPFILRARKKSPNTASPPVLRGRRSAGNFIHRSDADARARQSAFNRLARRRDEGKRANCGELSAQPGQKTRRGFE